jgi:hypothetical protein
VTLHEMRRLARTKAADLVRRAGFVQFWGAEMARDPLLTKIQLELADSIERSVLVYENKPEDTEDLPKRMYKHGRAYRLHLPSGEKVNLGRNLPAALAKYSELMRNSHFGN